MNRDNDRFIIIVLLFIIAFCILGVFFYKDTSNADAESGETWLSDEVLDAIYQVAEEEAIQPELIMAIVEVESSGQVSAKNGTCYGLMQVNGAVWGYGYTGTYNNIKKGVEILKTYVEQCNGDLCYALDCYNGNSKARYNYENGIVSSA
jgi:soluble lytic murein transglycosylase-like protein